MNKGEVRSTENEYKVGFSLSEGCYSESTFIFSESCFKIPLLLYEHWSISSPKTLECIKKDKSKKLVLLPMNMWHHKVGQNGYYRLHCSIMYQFLCLYILYWCLSNFMVAVPASTVN